MNFSVVGKKIYELFFFILRTVLDVSRKTIIQCGKAQKLTRTFLRERGRYVHSTYKNFRESINAAYRKRRLITIELTASICAHYIALRNDILLRIDSLLERRLINAQTQRPIEIMPEVDDEATWMFFRTTHPIITSDRLTFNGSRMNLKKQTPMVRDLFQIPGVAEVMLFRYDVRVTRGSMFPTRELTPRVMEVLRRHLG